jgi:hypothetical protein
LWQSGGEAGLHEQWLKKAKKAKGDHHAQVLFDRWFLGWSGRKAGPCEWWAKTLKGKQISEFRQLRGTLIGQTASQLKETIYSFAGDDEKVILLLMKMMW